jgi:hypothetical protein
METIVVRMAAAAGHDEGTGVGVESGSFTATVEIAPVLAGLGASIDYLATAADGTELRAEHTVLAFDTWSGAAELAEQTRAALTAR